MPGKWLGLTDQESPRVTVSAEKSTQTSDRSVSEEAGFHQGLRDGAAQATRP